MTCADWNVTSALAIEQAVSRLAKTRARMRGSVSDRPAPAVREQAAPPDLKVPQVSVQRLLSSRLADHQI